ncbi:cytochrome C oxidase subunit II [Bacillus sp. DNRA2]|uniref:cupredoxin domain-containing protein n=1 Tax=Bacillus sp. DNRA2 TaxID=2723053 RepID=UPI00145C40C2|nr:cupredoxin domain-containing protein [Bacillus sp. DNRA2]NMD71765.1 cytochrome C oxidase subunit II [Bacillus sp. DNRA2]
MQKKLLAIIMAGFVTFGLAGCGSGDEKDSTKEPESQETTAPSSNEESSSEKVEATGNVVETTVNMTNFQFDLKEIKVKAGDTVKLTVVNDVGSHGIAIDEFDVDVKGGETVEFVADQKGEYEYYCSLMCGTGHDTMAGKLIVE